MSHDHSHAHLSGSGTFNGAFALAVGLNLSFTLIEAIYAISANSMSLLADAGHNLGDVAGLLFAWGASWLLTKASSERFSYGYKRTTIVAALMNSLILVGTSAIIGYESIIKLIHPVDVHELTVVIVAAVGVLINGGTALLFMRGRKGDLNIKGAFLHLAYDALISVGVVMTGLAILMTGWTLLDPLVGLAIVAAILAGTWGLLRDSVNLILDAVPHNIDRNAVEQYLKNIEGVTGVHDLHIWGLSTKEAALTCHLVIPEGRSELSNEAYQKINCDLKDDFFIDHVTIQVERGDADVSCGQVCR